MSEIDKRESVDRRPLGILPVMDSQSVLAETAFSVYFMAVLHDTNTRMLSLSRLTTAQAQNIHPLLYYK